jgi:plastocyanin
MMKTRLLAVLGLALALPLAACGGENASAAPAAENQAAATAEAAPAAAPASGKVIEVKMVTDGANNYFEPAQIEAKQGDVLRFTLVSGVHNVSFPADQNANAAGLPAPSAFLASPGQAHDVPVTFAAGEYKFQCDPHAMLGMVGTIKVQ